MIINLATGWFKIFEIPTLDFDEDMTSNDEYRDKSSARFSQLFNNTCLCRNLCPRQVVFDNVYEFKQDLTPLLKYFDINLS